MIEALFILAITCGATILLEGIPVLFLKNKRAWWKASVLCNVVTNPALNVIMLLLPPPLHEDGPVACIVALLEVTVVFLEAWFYRLMLENSYKNCFLFSLVANGISFAAGCIWSVLSSIRW